jgi:tripartite-type tricarboxylate transporter receptor subunit TctC
VPYRGAAPALQDLTADEVGRMFVDSRPRRRNWRRRELGRSPWPRLRTSPLPRVPTIAASGYRVLKPGKAWSRRWQPCPRSRQSRATPILAGIRDADVTKKLTDAGIDILQSTAAEFADYMRSETSKWAAVIKAANIRAD